MLPVTVQQQQQQQQQQHQTACVMRPESSEPVLCKSLLQMHRVLLLSVPGKMLKHAGLPVVMHLAEDQQAQPVRIVCPYQHHCQQLAAPA